MQAAIHIVKSNLLVIALICFTAPSIAQIASPHAIDVPAWFTESFLDFREEIREAATKNKRLLVYFGQDGCPYCKALMHDNFGQAEITLYTQQHFVAIAVNIWGDREVTWLDNQVRIEKEFARYLGIQFTPTILLFDEQGVITARLNGYYPPQRFLTALKYAGDKRETARSFNDHMRSVMAELEQASPQLHQQAFFSKPPYDLSALLRSKKRPLAVLFEQTHCQQCDELHEKLFSRAEVRLRKLGRKVEVWE